MNKYEEAIKVFSECEDPESEEFTRAVETAIVALEQAAKREENKPLTYEEAVAIAEKEPVHIMLHNGNTATLPAIIHEDGTIEDDKVNTELVVLWNTAGITLPLTDINKRFTLYRYPTKTTLNEGEN